MLDWLPPPAEFRERLDEARRQPDPERRGARLAALAQARLGLVETIQLDNALREPGAAPPADFQRLRVALMGAGTFGHLPPGIRVAGLRHRLWLDLHAGGFGLYRQELDDPASTLHAFRPDFVVLATTPEDLGLALPLDAGAAAADAAVAAAAESLRASWRQAKRGGATVMQQSLLDVAEPLFGNHERLFPAAPSRLVARLNAALADAAAADGVLWLDLARASERDGLDAWFDHGRWLQAKMLIAPHAVPGFGELLARLIAASRGLSRKCLVLDLDDTLWGGIVGDDGMEGLVLGPGSARGEAHAELQRYARRLGERGVILAVCSKNDPALAEQAFREHPEMVLRPGDIAAFIANWEDKAENLRLIASRLNIGLDSIVFVDDNPVERARIRESLPMVAVPELPPDPSGFVRRLAASGYFETIAVTAEDRGRGAAYAAETHREALRGLSSSTEDFLEGLRMRLAWGPVGDVDLARAVQLINKTNQFNVTARRCSPEEFTAIARDPASLALQFRLADRFGDNGLVSVLVLRPAHGGNGALDVDTWVMSCRVFGRRLEDQILNVAAALARARGASALEATYVETARNGVVRDLFGRLGFAPLSDAATQPRWRLPLERFEPRPTRIALENAP